ncbi:hypothetical protein PRIPAC_73565 [Pristionchus pacificus]|uniref:Uncharacterized protein n=1 Tax=Pristionchus pacificus TaxID=54126 RepID=A0A2A6BZS6_PRIPA|nr:hypothetical protein PRIPAC_73565 [Pristionchus pacificus]|eukprot:PDM71359.1 hypothetical protein PRIPAC_37766 [Pristionchus pacificus]
MAKSWILIRCALFIIASVHVVDVSGICFISTTNSIRRQVIDVQSTTTTTQVGCTIICLNNANCQACIFNATTNRCVLLGGPDPAASDQCPAPYTSLVRTTSNCPVLTAFNVDLGYAPGPCSTSADVGASPVVLAKPVCGSFPSGNRKIVFDAILHDGTHMILESHTNSFIQWDTDLGSWYFSLNGLIYYFKCGTCVKPPVTQSDPCVCAPFAVEPPLAGFNTPTAPAIDSAPACPGMVQQHYNRVRGTGGAVQDVLDSRGRSVYCAMGEWMLLIDTSTYYNQYTVLAATCVTADAG